MEMDQVNALEQQLRPNKFYKALFQFIDNKVVVGDEEEAAIKIMLPQLRLTCSTFNAVFDDKWYEGEISKALPKLLEIFSKEIGTIVNFLSNFFK